MLTIDIWSDYACPYCYIAKPQLEQALKEMNITDYKITNHVYLLSPGKTSRPERTLIEGWNVPEAKREEFMKQMKEIEDMAAGVGLDYHMDQIRDVATEDAHRLTLWAQETSDKYLELNKRIFHGYFEAGEDVSSHDVLVGYAEEVGLDGAEARKILADASAYKMDMIEDLAEAEEREIDLVPHYVFNQTDDIMGIMSVKAIKKCINDAMSM